jgi:outer membrane protein OmpA-like peptidoglycan-associated protein
MKPFPAILLGAALALLAPAAHAAELSTDEIVCRLDPKCAKPLSRAMPRGVTASGGAAGEAPLSVDLYVNFAFDSAELTSDARITLDRLGAALSDPRLQAFSFQIAGHTDATGGAEYNQRLSERRAEAVRRYLVARHGVAPARLSALGYGESRLLDPARPEDGVNRRVQVTNVTAAPPR